MLDIKEKSIKLVKGTQNLAAKHPATAAAIGILSVVILPWYVLLPVGVVLVAV